MIEKGETHYTVKMSVQFNIKSLLSINIDIIHTPTIQETLLNTCTVDNELNLNKHTKVLKIKTTLRAVLFRKISYKNTRITIQQAIKTYKYICRLLFEYTIFQL